MARCFHRFFFDVLSVLCAVSTCRHDVVVRRCKEGKMGVGFRRSMKKSARCGVGSRGVFHRWLQNLGCSSRLGNGGMR